MASAEKLRPGRQPRTQFHLAMQSRDEPLTAPGQTKKCGCAGRRVMTSHARHSRSGCPAASVPPFCAITAGRDSPVALPPMTGVRWMAGRLAEVAPQLTYCSDHARSPSAYARFRRNGPFRVSAVGAHAQNALHFLIAMVFRLSSDLHNRGTGKRAQSPKKSGTCTLFWNALSASYSAVSEDAAEAS